MQITYREFMAQINRTANLFHDLGIGPKDVISYLLPNLPQTHYVLWGGEAAGIVNPINPLLEPATIAEICRSAGTSVLVSLGEFPGTDLWEKAQAVRKELPDLKAVVRVTGPGDEKEISILHMEGDIGKGPFGFLVLFPDMKKFYHFKLSRLVMFHQLITWREWRSPPMTGEYSRGLIR